MTAAFLTCPKCNVLAFDKCPRCECDIHDARAGRVVEIAAGEPTRTDDLAILAMALIGICARLERIEEKLG